MPEGNLHVEFAGAEDALSAHDGRLVDLVDGLLASGVVLRGELWLTVADVELVYLGLNLVLASPDSLTKCGEGP
jgi:hypothetical protein